MKNDKMILFINLTVKRIFGNSWFENVTACNGSYWKANWHCTAFNKYIIFSVLGRRTTVLETNLSAGFLLPLYSDLLDILMLRRELQMEEMLFVLAEICIY